MALGRSELGLPHRFRSCLHGCELEYHVTENNCNPQNSFPHFFHFVTNGVIGNAILRQLESLRHLASLEPSERLGVKKDYLVQLEIAGHTAMWTRPDTGDAPVSYLAPTFSAAKGIFESVCSLSPSIKELLGVKPYGSP